MTAAPKVIAPRAPEAARSRTTTTGLPDDLLTEQMRRLRLCAAVAMGLWTFGLVMDAFVRPGTVGAPFFVSTLVHRGRGDCRLGACSSPTCGSRRTRRACRPTPGWSSWCSTPWAWGCSIPGRGPLTDDALNELSWNTIVILCGAMLMPATPKQMLVAALLVGVDGSAGRLPSPHLRGREVPVGDAHAGAVPAELRLRPGGDGAREHPAPPRPPPAPGARAGQLPPRARCSAAAAWAKCGWPATSCSRAAPP